MFGLHMYIKQFIAILQWRKLKCRQNEINFPQSDNESVTELIKETTSPDEAEEEKAVAGDFHRHNTKLNTDGDDFSVEVVTPSPACSAGTH